MIKALEYPWVDLGKNALSTTMHCAGTWTLLLWAPINFLTRFDGVIVQIKQCLTMKIIISLRSGWKTRGLRIEFNWWILKWKPDLLWAFCTTWRHKISGKHRILESSFPRLYSILLMIRKLFRSPSFVCSYILRNLRSDNCKSLMSVGAELLFNRLLIRVADCNTVW